MLDEKDAYIAKHRRRLRSEAGRREAVERLNGVITTLEQARAYVVASVEAERWAAEFPRPEADSSPLRLLLVRGGRPSTAMPELRVQLAFERLAGLLRHDAAWLDQVTADEDDDGELDPDKQAVWEQSDEDRKALGRQTTRCAKGSRRATSAKPAGAS